MVAQSDEQSQPRKRSLASQVRQIEVQMHGLLGVAAQALYGEGESFRYQDEVEFPAASIIKIPIAVCVMREVAAGRVRLDEQIPLRVEDIVGGAGVLLELHPGIALTVHDLLALMIVVSDNTATNMLINRIGIDEINRQMHDELGMPHCFLRGLLMIPHPTLPAERKNVIVASEILHLLAGIERGTVAPPDLCAELINIMKRQQYNTRIPAGVPKDVPVAHKTGEIEQVRHDAGIVYGERGPYAVVILTRNLEDETRGEQAAVKVSALLWNAFGAGNEHS